MALIEKMTEYYKVVFLEDQAAQQASNALMSFVTANVATMMTMVGPKRAVMWEEKPGPFNTTLYLRPGAVSVLQGLGVALPSPQKTAPADLPEGRVMMLGDASDWNK